MRATQVFGVLKQASYSVSTSLGRIGKLDGPIREPDKCIAVLCSLALALLVRITPRVLPVTARLRWLVI